MSLLKLVNKGSYVNTLEPFVSNSTNTTTHLYPNKMVENTTPFEIAYDIELQQAGI
jgi:hypothetical protein